MKIEQFEDKNLAHFSYAILSEGKVALVDPARNPKPYYDFAKQNNAEIVAVIETHPHADFVSSHFEIHKAKGSTVYVSKLLGANYPHQTFDEGDVIELEKVKLKAWNTPGHSADSITIILEDENGKDVATFTGDTLFIGDCGRPDLRENVGNVQQKREEQAKQMYHSLKKYLTLNDDVLIYPAHGAGSLCGKGLSEANSSTMGAEKRGNWSLQPTSEEDFVKTLISDQPFIPHYFGFDVDTNRNGANDFQPSINKVKALPSITNENEAKQLKSDITIVDARNESTFKHGHIKGSINIQDGNSFETWLGSIIKPGEKFYLAVENENQLTELVKRTAKIGYEQFIEAAFVLNYGNTLSPKTPLDDFKEHPENYTIIDVRSESEAKEKKFGNVTNIPLHELRERVEEIPTNKPVLIHCAGGYRSAAASSIVEARIDEGVKVYDLSEAVKNFN